MSKFLLSISLIFASLFLYPQKRASTGGDFIKRIEFNVFSAHVDSTGEISYKFNIEGKGKDEILLFGENNEYVEFYTLPSFEGIYGFRIIDSKGNFPIIEFRQISDTTRNLLPISYDFAQLLHEKAQYMIGNFKGISSRRIANGMIWEDVILDGDTRIFRCVVDDEVWMLKIHEPKGKLKEFSNICENIYRDLKNSVFHETKYLEELKSL